MAAALRERGLLPPGTSDGCLRLRERGGTTTGTGGTGRVTRVLLKTPAERGMALGDYVRGLDGFGGGNGGGGVTVDWVVQVRVEGGCG